MTSPCSFAGTTLKSTLSGMLQKVIFKLDMKKFFAILLCAISLSAIADNSDWLQLHRTPALTIYVDVNSIGTHGKFTAAQIMTDYVKPQTPEDKSIHMKSMVTGYLYDCRERKSGHTHHTAYSGNMGRGDLVFHSPFPLNLRDVVPGTVGEAQLNFVCRHPAAVAGRQGISSPSSPAQSASANNSGWDLIVGHGSANIYVDSATIKKLDARRARAWVMAEYPKTQVHEKTGEFYRSITSLETYDCKENRLGYTELIYHAGSMGIGKIISHEKDLPINYVSLLPESVGEIRLKHICSRAKN